ncbi:hypothetical protein IGI04_031000, partial [Brassica rapa subsp. trilocularis]
MSNETKDLYNYQYPSSFSLYEMMNLPSSAQSSYGNNGFDHGLHSSPGAHDSLLQKTFGLSPPSSEVFNSSIDQESNRCATNDVTGETPTRVSASSSSSEADHSGEDCGKSQRKRELAEDGREENRSSKTVLTHDMFRTAALDYGYGQSGYGNVNANPSSHQEYRQG